MPINIAMFIQAPNQTFGIYINLDWLHQLHLVVFGCNPRHEILEIIMLKEANTLCILYTYELIVIISIGYIGYIGYIVFHIQKII